MPKRQISLKSWLVEIFSIVLGVLLALRLNEWRQHRANQALANVALKNVAREIQSNESVLKRIHQNNVRALRQPSATSGPSGGGEIRFVPGLQLKSTAWQTMASAGIVNFVDYQIVLNLSDLYSVQDVYQQTGRLLVEAALNISAYAAATAHNVSERIFENQFEDYLEMTLKIEEELLNEYAEAGKLWKETH